MWMTCDVPSVTAAMLTEGPSRLPIPESWLRSNPSPLFSDFNASGS